MGLISVNDIIIQTNCPRRVVRKTNRLTGQMYDASNYYSQIEARLMSFISNNNRFDLDGFLELLAKNLNSFNGIISIDKNINESGIYGVDKVSVKIEFKVGYLVDIKTFNKFDDMFGVNKFNLSGYNECLENLVKSDGLYEFVSYVDGSINYVGSDDWAEKFLKHKNRLEQLVSGVEADSLKDISKKVSINKKKIL